MNEFTAKVSYFIRAALLYELYANKKLEEIEIIPPADTEKIWTVQNIEKVYYYYRGIVSLLHLVSGQEILSPDEADTLRSFFSDEFIDNKYNVRFTYSTYIFSKFPSKGVKSLKFINFDLERSTEDYLGDITMKVVQTQAKMKTAAFLHYDALGESIHDGIKLYDELINRFINDVNKESKSIQFIVRPENMLSFSTNSQPSIKVKETNETISLKYNFQQTLEELKALGFYVENEFKTYHTILTVGTIKWSSVKKQNYSYDKVKNLYMQMEKVNPKQTKPKIKDYEEDTNQSDEEENTDTPPQLDKEENTHPQSDELQQFPDQGVNDVVNAPNAAAAAVASSSSTLQLTFNEDGDPEEWFLNITSHLVVKAETAIKAGTDIGIYFKAYVIALVKKQISQDYTLIYRTACKFIITPILFIYHSFFHCHYRQ